MILVSFKKYFNSPTDILRVLMALVFLSAGFFRIFNPELAKLELVNLNLPLFLSYFLIILEIVGGFLLLINKGVKEVSILFVVFLIFALGWLLLSNGRAILEQAGELFILNSNPTDFFLHLVFLIILVCLFIYHKK